MNQKTGIALVASVGFTLALVGLYGGPIAFLIGIALGGALGRHTRNAPSELKPRTPMPALAPLEAGSRTEPPRPQPPSFEERLESVGIRVGGNAMSGGRTIVVADGRSLSAPTPEMLGMTAAVRCDETGRWLDPHGGGWMGDGPCDYCDGAVLYRLYRVLKKKVPAGARDLGLVEVAKIGDACSSCGLLKDWPVTDDAEAFGDMYCRSRNFLALLEVFEKERGTTLHAQRLRLIEAEAERVDGRRAELFAEKARLQRQLAPPDTTPPPYRDDP